jgi:hypothetical protein
MKIDLDAFKEVILNKAATVSPDEEEMITALGKQCKEMPEFMALVAVNAMQISQTKGDPAKLLQESLGSLVVGILLGYEAAMKSQEKQQTTLGVEELERMFKNENV